MIRLYAEQAAALIRAYKQFGVPLPLFNEFYGRIHAVDDALEGGARAELRELLGALQVSKVRTISALHPGRLRSLEPIVSELVERDTSLARRSDPISRNDACLVVAAHSIQHRYGLPTAIVSNDEDIAWGLQEFQAHGAEFAARYPEQLGARRRPPVLYYPRPRIPGPLYAPCAPQGPAWPRAVRNAAVAVGAAPREGETGPRAQAG